MALNWIDSVKQQMNRTHEYTSILYGEENELNFDEFQNSSVNTQCGLTCILEVLIGKDGAQVLSNKFKMKFAVVVKHGHMWEYE